MRGFLRLVPPTLSPLIWTACATMNISSHVQRGLDITQCRTYDWGPADALPTGDPRLDQDPYFPDRVAPTNTLVWRGWAEGSIEGAIVDQKLTEERIDEAVAKTLARLPPRS